MKAFTKPTPTVCFARLYLIAGVRLKGNVRVYVQDKLGLAMAGRVLLAHDGFSCAAVRAGVEMDIEANWIDAIRVCRLVFQKGKRVSVSRATAYFGGAN